MFNSDKYSLQRKGLNLIACLLLLGLIANAQQAPRHAERLRELHRLPGRLVVHSRSAEPLGNDHITGYQIEELALPSPVEAEVSGRKAMVTRAWRVTILGGPFPVRAMIPAIWIDRNLLGYGFESEDMASLSVIVFDRSLLREGGILAVSYGGPDDERTTLPEPLKLGDGK